MISVQSIIKETCHNSRTNNDTDTKFGPVTNLDKIKETPSKNFEDNAMSENCDAIVFSKLWPFWGNPEAGFRVHSPYAFICTVLIKCLALRQKTWSN